MSTPPEPVPMISVSINGFTVHIRADTEAGQTIAAAALEVMSDPRNTVRYESASP